MSVFGSTFLFSQGSYPPAADESSILSFATKCRSSDRHFCFAGRAFDSLLRYEMSVFGSTFLFSQGSYPPAADESSILSFATKCRSSDRLFCFAGREFDSLLRYEMSVFGSTFLFSRGSYPPAADERSILSFATKCRSSDRHFCFCGVQIRFGISFADGSKIPDSRHEQAQHCQDDHR